MTPYGKSVVASVIGLAIGLCLVAVTVYVAKQSHVSDAEPTSPDERHREIEAARQRWHANAPSAYSFEYRVDCFCANAMIWWRVVVEDGKVVGSSIVDASNARRRTGDPNRNHPTIDSLFESLAQAEATHPYMLSVVYDDALHYPRRAFVDPHGLVVDDEWTIEIRRLAPVGGSEIEIEKAEEKQRIQNEPPKLSSSQLMQIASDLERGGKRDEARKAYITAASRGSCEAAARLGDIYGEGGGGIRRDYAESLKWYNAARVLGCSVPTEKLR